MINITHLNEVHESLLNNTPKAIALNMNIGVFLVPRSKYASLSATIIGTPVLLTYQNEVQNGGRRHS
jgi:hypothetical protein